MAHYVFFPAPFGPANSTYGVAGAVSATPAEVSDYALRYRASHRLPLQPDLADVSLPTAPAVRHLDDVVNAVPEDQRDELRMRLRGQAEKYHGLAEDLMPSLPGEPATALTPIALADTLLGYPSGSIGAIRVGPRVGVLALFPGWSIDHGGSLAFDPPGAAEPALTPRAGGRGVPGLMVEPAETWGESSREVLDPDPNPEVARSATSFADVTLEVISYIGQGLAMANPLAGLTLAFFSQEVQKAADAMSGAPGLLDEISDLLEANTVKLEGDLSKSPIRTYASWSADHYSDSWLADIMGAPDLKKPDIARKLKQLNEFIKGVSTDLNSRDASILDAVNLLRDDSLQPNTDLLKPTDAMWKASGYIYAANFVLAKGRQAFNAQYTLYGANKSADLAASLTNRSAEYLAYVESLRDAVDKQVAARIALIRTEQLTGGSQANDYFKLYDRRTEPDFDSDLGVIVYDGQPCCGSSDCASKYQATVAAGAKLQRIKSVEYRTKLCSWFWGDDSSFDSAVAAMKTNDTALQALTAACRAATS